LTLLPLQFVRLRVKVFDPMHVQSLLAQIEWFRLSTEQQIFDTTDRPNFEFWTAAMVHANRFSGRT
jgi:hypothetical protein